MKNINTLKKALEKRDIQMNLSVPSEWVSTGNMALNYCITGDFYKGVPNKRSMVVAGPSGSGKSLLAGTIAKNWQDKGYYVIYIDTEDAIDPQYLDRIGLNMNEDVFLPLRISTIEELTEIMSDVFKNYQENDKLCIVVDSASMLETEKELDAFEKGELSNDMGLFSKKLKQLWKNINVKVGDKDISFLATEHTYLNQDIKNGKGKYIVSGGEAQLYIPSITLMFDKLKLKEGTEISGFRLKSETIKTRFSKLGSKCELRIPYETGIDKYDGVLDILEKEGYVNRNGAWYNYTKDGEEIKFQSKDFNKHIENLLPKEKEVVEEQEN